MYKKSVSFASFSMHDREPEAWRSKIEIPVFPKGKSRGIISIKYKPILLAIFVIGGMFTLYQINNRNNYFSSSLKSNNFNPRLFGDSNGLSNRKLMSYNHTYPLTKPVTTPAGAYFRIGMITDMDTASKVAGKENMWQSLLRFATFYFDNRTLTTDITWKGGDDDAIHLFSKTSSGGRGMELSELCVFNAKVYSIDDRTGIVYEILEDRVAPWTILADGDGHQTKGFKGEWMTVKDEKMYIGGLGKDWTTADGKVLHHDPQWIKTIDKDNSVSHVNWLSVYRAIQKAAGIESPGYIIHESCVWSNIHESWFFLPRRASTEHYDEDADEHRGTNLLFQCSEDFSNIKVTRIGKLEHKTRGFSSFKFVPGTNDDIIIALKTEEVEGQTKSYLTVFRLNGEILFPDHLVSHNYKYEGIEFL